MVYLLNRKKERIFLMTSERKIEYYCAPASQGVTIDRDGTISFPPFYSPEDKQRWIEDFNTMMAQIANNTTE